MITEIFRYIMKQKLLLFLLTLMSVCSVSAQVGVRYTTTTLNMRESATVNSAIVTTIPRGTSVTIEDDCNCKWIPVSYSGNIGYVSSKYLSKSRPRQHVAVRQGAIRYYRNSQGHRVQSPTRYSSVPPGATALCNDGTYSFSHSHKGTCSHHGGVARWYR